MSRSLLDIEINYNSEDDLQCRLPAECVGKLSRSVIGTGATTLMILVIESDSDEVTPRVAYVIYHGKVACDYQTDKLVMPVKIANLFGFSDHERVLVRLCSKGSLFQGHALQEADTVQLQVKSKFEWDLLSAAVVERLEGELLQLVNIVHLGQRLSFPLSASVSLSLTVSDIRVSSSVSTPRERDSESESASWFGGGVVDQLQSLYKYSGAWGGIEGAPPGRPFLVTPRTTLVVSPPQVPLVPGVRGPPPGKILAAGGQGELEAIAGCVSNVRLIDAVKAAQTAIQAGFCLQLHRSATDTDQAYALQPVPAPVAVETDVLDAALEMLEFEFLGGHSSPQRLRGGADGVIEGPITANGVTATDGDSGGSIIGVGYWIHPDSVLVPVAAAFLAESALALRSCGLGASVGGAQARWCEQQWLREHLWTGRECEERLLRHFRWVRLGTDEKGTSAPVCLCYSRDVQYRWCLTPHSGNGSGSSGNTSSGLRLQFLPLDEVEALALTLPPPATPGQTSTSPRQDCSVAAESTMLHGLDVELSSIVASLDVMLDCEDATQVDSAVLLLGAAGSGKSSVVGALRTLYATREPVRGRSLGPPEFVVLDCRDLAAQSLPQVLSALESAFAPTCAGGALLRRVLVLDSVDALCMAPGAGEAAGAAPDSHDAWLRVSAITHCLYRLLAANDLHLSQLASQRQQLRRLFCDHTYSYVATSENENCAGATGATMKIEATRVPPDRSSNSATNPGMDADAVRVLCLVRDQCSAVAARSHGVLLTAAAMETLHPTIALLFRGQGVSPSSRAAGLPGRHCVVHLPAVDSHPRTVLRRVLHARLAALRAALYTLPPSGDATAVSAVQDLEWLDSLLLEVTVPKVPELCKRAVCHALSDGVGRVADDSATLPVLESHLRRAAADLTVVGAPKAASASKLTGAGASNVAPKFRRATFAHVSGYENALHQLSCVLIRPTRYSKLFALSPVRLPRNVLIYGPPGCGKTLLAHAVVNEMGCRCIVIHGPELLNKYTGASEKAVRDVFARAKAAAPCVILFDEFEALGSRRGQDNTGVTDRVVNQLLTFIDGAERTMGTSGGGVDGQSAQVYIVAASSRPDMIDPALLRPGRVERHVFAGLPGSTDCLAVLKSLLQPLFAASTAIAIASDSASVSAAGGSGSVALTAATDANMGAAAVDMGLYSWYAGDMGLTQTRSAHEQTWEQFVPVCEEMAAAAVERRLTVADLEAAVKAAYAESIYKTLACHTQEGGGGRECLPQVTAVFSPDQLLAAFHASSPSLSAADLRFYDSIYAKFAGIDCQGAVCVRGGSRYNSGTGEKTSFM